MTDRHDFFRYFDTLTSYHTRMIYNNACSQIKKDREDILLELRNSVKTNNVVGIFVKDTNELLTTAVRNLEERENGDIRVVLEDQDLHGYPILKNTLPLTSIDKVIHFSLGFNDPHYVRVRRIEKLNA